MCSYEGWTLNLRLHPVEQRKTLEAKNKAISTRLIQKLFAARILVFELFLLLCKEVHGALAEKHKYLWLEFQLRESVYLDAERTHPFIFVLNEGLMSTSQEFLNSILISRVDRIRNDYLHSDDIFYVIDEAQQAARSYPFAFLSSLDPETPRSVLREITRIATEGSVKLVLSGIGLTLEEVEAAVASGIMKPRTPHEKFKLFHNLGGFDDWNRLGPYICCYIPKSVLDTLTMQRLQYRIRQYLWGR